MTMLDNQVIPQVDSILRFQSFDKMKKVNSKKKDSDGGKVGEVEIQVTDNQTSNPDIQLPDEKAKWIPTTQKAYEEFEVFNDHFGHVYYNPARALQAGDFQKSRIGLIPLPPESWLMKKFGIKNSFMDQYQKMKNEYFEALDANEETNEEEFNKRDIAKMERQTGVGKQLVTNLKLQKGFTNKEISRLSGIPISTLQDWGFFDNTHKTATTRNILQRTKLITISFTNVSSKFFPFFTVLFLECPVSVGNVLPS
jgi:hypothetical protein